jgi:hypothetical protein
VRGQLVSSSSHGIPSFVFSLAREEENDLWRVVASGDLIELEVHRRSLARWANFVWEQRDWDSLLFHAAEHNNITAAVFLVTQCGAYVGSESRNLMIFFLFIFLCFLHARHDQRARGPPAPQ